MAKKMYLCLFIIAAMSCSMMKPVVSMDHIVGGSLGWTTTPNVTFYQEWAKPRTFGVGDKLVFPYRTGVQNVIEVNKKEYDACTQEKAIEMYYKGPLVLQLTEPGERYFYCGVGTHCEHGTKLAITVGTAPGSSGMHFTVRESEKAGSPAVAPSSSSGNSIEKFGVVAAGLVALLVSYI